MMGQVQEKSKEEPTFVHDTVNNGLILGNQYIPEEVLADILFHADHKTLAKCMLVCKRWNVLIRNYVWRKKSEVVLGLLLPLDDRLPWILHYLICTPNTPFKKNLIKNHSGSQGLKKHWKILRNQGNKWAIEEPPVGVPPLPEIEPLFKERKICFVTCFDYCSKKQDIDLIAEGFISRILDEVQPPILFSEWYSARWDCRALYECSVTLLRENDDVINSFEFRDVLEHEKLNKWLQVTHEFKNYGKGLRKISFWHQGKDNQFWAGHYGSKMAGASIRIGIPYQEKKPVQE